MAFGIPAAYIDCDDIRHGGKGGETGPKLSKEPCALDGFGLWYSIRSARKHRTVSMDLVSESLDCGLLEEGDIPSGDEGCRVQGWKSDERPDSVAAGRDLHGRSHRGEKRARKSTG